MNELTRRRFIRQSAAGAIPAVHVRASESSSSALLRWGIIGTGTRGNMTHVTALAAAGPAPECELLALCDVVEERLQGAAKRSRKEVATYGDYQKLLANPDINAV